ncbi:M-phase phosphoprotein 8 isoform X1 [Pantherophis guttatus]|uniref:M-phase phosphoprotein 8 isoform X1 n=1 Tax=Pantherophis guttatus TaxID=94885 RepID=A0A6P9B3H5_PANGU|nr:M-phase phosphoprotein 8 isoform X1 [Pantherophis guttatus]
MAAAVSGAKEQEGVMAAKPPADGRAGESGMDSGTATVTAGAGGGTGGGESEDEEESNVYEVEKILDMKTEDGEVKYKVRWKGYAPDDDTWEPEEHLKDCKEVLLEFRRKMLDNKSKPVKKEIQKMPLNDDLFEADSEADSDWQSDTKGDRSPKKKKKKSKDKEDKNQDEIHKKKHKLGKVKEKPFLECENSSDSLASDSKPKKRTSESKEEVKDSKKQRREDIKDNSKKKEWKDGKKKMKEESKENKHMQKGRHSINHLDGESSMQDDSFSQAADFESEDSDSDSSEGKRKTPSGKHWVEEFSVHQPSSTSSTDDSSEIRVKKKKKKRKKSAELDENRKIDKHLEKKSTQKKQKTPETTKAAPELENKRPFISAPTQKPLKSSVDERGCRPNDTGAEGSSNTKWKSKEAKPVQSYGGNVLQKATTPESKAKNINWRSDEEKIKEKPSQHSLGQNLFEKFIMDMECSKGGSMVAKKNLPKIELNVEEIPKERSILPKEKETKKSEIKEKLQKKLDSEKEEKNRKEQRPSKNLKEVRSAFDVFSISSEEKNEYLDSRKKEESAHESRSTDEFRLKDKHGRSSRDETDTWAYIAAEGDHEITSEDTSDTKQQTMSLGMDMQLEWLSLEDFQKHLDGEDEEPLTNDVISSVQLRDAVKNGNYTMVKMALNSNEEYNLDQEDSSGMTLVMLASASGHDDILRLLIRKGAKVNCKQKNGTTALIHAAEKNNLTTVALLLEAGAYVNVQQKNGETALMKACKRGNYDIVRLMIENGADCNILSKHQSNALHFAKQCNNLSVSELLRSHLAMLTRVAEETIREYFEARLSLMEPIFDIACHLLCEGPDYSSEFTYKAPQNVPEGSGILLFIFHANFLGNDIIARLCGPCSVQAVVLNDKFQLPVFLPNRACHPGQTEQLTQRILQDSHFIYSFSPIQGLNKLFIRLAEVPTAKVKLLIAAYRVQLQ